MKKKMLIGLGFPDLWSGQKPSWNWYLTPVVNFGEVWRTQLANPLSSPPCWCPWDLSRSLSSVHMLKRENGVQNAMGSYHTYSSLVKLQPCFLSFQWKTCLRQNCNLSLQWKICLWIELQPWFLSLRWKTCLRQICNLGSCSCSEGHALGQKTDDDIDPWYCILFFRGTFYTLAILHTITNTNVTNMFFNALKFGFSI